MTAVTGHLLYGTVHVKDETPAPSEPPATPAGETALYLGVADYTPSESRAGCKGGGVQLSALGSEGCAAYVLADRYMKEYFPLWYERYPVVVRDPGAYFAVEGDAGSFSWDTTGAGLTDPDGIYDMSAEEALKLIFGT